jgi:hypothetical protein
MFDQPFANGHCLCGAVSYTIHGKPIRMAQCHCKDCQRASGTGHMSLAFFKKDDVAIVGALRAIPQLPTARTSTHGIFARHAVVACMGKIQRVPA